MAGVAGRSRLSIRYPAGRKVTGRWSGGHTGHAILHHYTYWYILAVTGKGVSAGKIEVSCIFRLSPGHSTDRLPVILQKPKTNTLSDINKCKYMIHTCILMY